MCMNAILDLSMHNNIIIVDFDDTLCLYKNADDLICSGEPNYDLINELNRLYILGYEIHIYTARGHLSCNSREDADYKYRNIIEKWLKNNNVMYNVLSFNKSLAIYYIDDKSIRPNEINILKELK